MKVRLRELDFLRGIAILLVLMRHEFLFQFTTNMGWIGVDLFFVLSGFLVSGLLFKEYLKFGNIQPKLFLIRRGFKIYPIYYLSYLLYLIPIFMNDRFKWNGVLSDLFFIQNYISGWGYAYAASWSLAIEEHFYFGFAVLLWVCIRRNIFKLNKNTLGITRFEILVIIILVVCFCLRMYSNIYFPDNSVKNFTMSHLRVDSLFAGVLVSYLYYFRAAILKHYFNRFKKIMLPISFVLLLFTPLIDPIGSFYIKTFGFSLLYVSFSILLLYFLLEETINYKLNKYFSSKFVNILASIGRASYSIYIIHTLVNYYFKLTSELLLGKELNHFIVFGATTLISVLLGGLMTKYVEGYFLKIRDEWFPTRIS